MNSNKKIIISLVCFVGIVMISIVFAAFSNSLILNVTTTQAGTFNIKVTNCTVTSTLGMVGGVAISASCTPAGANTSNVGVVTAVFQQPGDSVVGKFTIKNVGNLKAKASGNCSCSGVVSPFYVTCSWGKTALAAGAQAANDLVITLSYSTNVIAQPTTTAVSATCSFQYTQNI